VAIGDCCRLRSSDCEGFLTLDLIGDSQNGTLVESWLVEPLLYGSYGVQVLGLARDPIST
jgi:hypothetical protein